MEEPQVAQGPRLLVGKVFVFTRILAGMLLLWGEVLFAEPLSALLDQLKNPDQDVRRQAVARLGDVGDQTAVTPLVQALADSDEVVRQLAEHSLWQVWSRSGDATVDALYQEGIFFMQSGQLPEAVAKFGEVIALAPTFAEAWNKRATVYYLQGEFEKSLTDCEVVIRLNPVHFGALSGMGLNHLQLDQPEQALGAFERALQVNPNLDQIRALAEELREQSHHRRQDYI